ncbi:hypothetical protein EVAR_13332_1 [Eumeta japonica]|uniref:Uncharacterized protein n=1 Tax=Eumeta variegata TaxID=151549 RepID=A0A4C1TRT8_EUMVA|nr:hypothetical protein EVAR_13332_1 [Eumeta japonica]
MYSRGPNCDGDVVTPDCRCGTSKRPARAIRNARLFQLSSLTRLSAPRTAEEYGRHSFVFSLTPRVFIIDKFLKRRKEEAFNIWHACQ